MEATTIQLEWLGDAEENNEMLSRLAEVKFGNSLDRAVKINIRCDLALFEAKSAAEINRMTMEAVIHVLKGVEENRLNADELQVVNLPVSDVTVGNMEAIPIKPDGESLAHRYRYGDFLYYKEVEGRPKITKICAGNHEKNPCDSFDMFINLNSPLLRHLLGLVDELCYDLARLGIASAQLHSIDNALKAIDANNPCRKAAQDTTTSQLRPKDKPVH